MRTIASTLAALFVVAGAASAQGVPAQPQENLDTVLRGWEKSMTDLKSFAAKVERHTLDKALQTRDTYKGYAMFMKANVKDDSSRARLQLSKVNNDKVFEKFICTGTYLYEYAPANQVVRVHNMPDNKKAGQQESFLSFLFGMGAEQAKARYDMKHVVANDETAKYYHYIQIFPKLPQDKGDFAEAQLSLYRANNLPARIWYRQANGNEITWNFTELQIDVNIPLQWFSPDTPDGWRVERVPAPGAAAAVNPKVRN